MLDCLLHGDCAGLICVLVAIATYRCLLTVRRGERVLLRSCLSGTVRLLEAGLHFKNGLTEVVHTTSPWAGLLKSGAVPAPGQRVVLDPASTMLHTKERVPGTVDVSAEATVLPWGLDVLSARVPFHENANRRINRWLCRTLDGLAAEDFSFGHLSSVLNTPAALEALNSDLTQFHLRVECVHLDPNGVTLDPQHIAQRQASNIGLQQVEAERRQLEQLAQVEAARRENKSQQLEFELRQQQLTQDAQLRRQTAEAQHAVELARLEAQAATQATQARAAAVAQLIQAGLSPTDVAGLMAAEAAASAVASSGASTTLLAVPPAMLGLGGLAGLRGVVGAATATSDAGAGRGLTAAGGAGGGFVAVPALSSS